MLSDGLSEEAWTKEKSVCRAHITGRIVNDQNQDTRRTMTQQTSFEGWVRRVARDLSVRRDELAERAPGSFSEAANYLTLPQVLGPGEDGLPGAYGVSGDEEYVVIALYAAAFVPAGDYSGSVEVLCSIDHRLEHSSVDVVVVAWERSEGGNGRETARIIASRREVPVASFACGDLDGLRRLYEIVASSRHAS